MYPKLVVVVVGLGAFLVPLALMYVLFVLPAPSSRIESTPVKTATTTPASATTSMNTPPELSRADVILNWYAPLIPLTLGDQTLQASVADTEPEREQGLSDTPTIPQGIVKLFVFDTAAPWAFWMKDMRYPIDIIWLDEHKTVIHVESNLTPETYPKSFAPSSPATYVIETESGFAEANHITVGTKGEW